MSTYKTLEKGARTWYDSIVMEWVLLVLAVLAVIIFAITYWTYAVTFYSPKKRNYNIFDIPPGEQYDKDRERMVQLIKDMDAVSYEEVRILALDGTPLFARYYHVADGAPLQIEFHGYKGTSIRDFCGGAKLAWKLGHNTLAVDQRAIGQSGGTTITFGLKERYDVLSWIDYAKERFGQDVPIYLAGVSMGATTVLMASGFDLPSNVKGIIADCPFSSPEDIIYSVAKDMGYPPKLAMPFIKLGAKLFGKFDLTETTAAEQVKKAKVPILIMHGEDDWFVPCRMSEEIYLANPEKITRETFAGAGHGLSYIENAPKYERLITELVERCERENEKIK